MKSRIFTILMLVFPGILFAQNQTLQFSLQEAQDYALENNKTYKNAKADIKLADAQLREAKGAGLPQVEATVDYMTNFGYEFEFNLGGGGDTEPPVVDYTVMDQGDFEVLKILEGMSSGGGSTIKMTDQASANVQVSQLIFSGQYWVGVEMARLGKTIREKSLSMTALDIKEQVINSYYLILITEDLLRVIGDNEKNLREIHRHTENMYKAGFAEITDVDQITINISQLENSKKAMERNRQLNFNMFRMLMGMEPGTQFELKDDLDSILARTVTGSVDSDKFNVNNNVTYQMMAVQERIGEEGINMQKWSYAPTLVGFYTYKEKIMRSAFDLSPNHAAGFSMKIPIFSGWSKSAKISQAKIELDKTERTMSLLEDQLALQNNQLNYNLTSAFENYNTQKESVDIAKRVYNNIRNKYEQGVLSSLELTQANGNYLQAENNYVSSVLELLKSKLALDKLNNKL